MNELSIKNNSFLKKIHRRTKSNFDNHIENSLSKTEKTDSDYNQSPQKTLQKTISSNFEPQNKENMLTSDQTHKILADSAINTSNKEIFIEKLDLTPEEMIIQYKKSDLKNNSDIFEFGKKKQLDLMYIKGLETSKSSNFEDRISNIRQKYQLPDENDKFFVIPEQNNEIEENRKDSIKDKVPFEFFQMKDKNILDKNLFAKKNFNTVEVSNKNKKSLHQKTISLVLNRQNSNKLALAQQISNFNANNHIANNEKKEDNFMKTLQNLEKRVFCLENQVIALKSENLHLLQRNQQLEKTLEIFSKENSSSITITVSLEKRFQELERMMKKTSESLNLIHKNIKTHVNEDPILNGSAEKNHISNSNLKINEENIDFLSSTKKIATNNIGSSLDATIKANSLPLRKSLDSTLTKSSVNFFEKIVPKSEIESNLNEYILKKGGKIMKNLANKKIFLTPKGMERKSIDKTFGNK